MKSKLIFSLLFTFLSFNIFAQKTTILRGNIYDKANGQPIPFANILLRGTPIGTTSDLNGFYQIPNAPVGEISMVVTFVGYDSAAFQIMLKEGEIAYKSAFLTENMTNLPFSIPKDTAKRPSIV